MFKRILVPLDGSARSEQALPLAAHIARTYNCSLVLTRIVDIFETIGASSIQAAALTNEIREIQEKEAQEYLQRIYNARELEHLERAIEVHSGDVATMLVEMIDRESIDLVVMSSHGHTGYKRWMLGSVAHKMVHDSPAPVLIQREHYAFPCGTARGNLKLCVALDGSELAESTIRPTLYLAAACGNVRQREVHLLRVVKTIDADRVEIFRRIHKLDLQQFLYNEAANYLKELSERLNREAAAQLYEGRTDFEQGRVFGHENLGEVVEVGEGVDSIKVGDIVCLPFNIACGFCANCEKGLTAFCLTANPNPQMAGAAYGFADMGPYNGGQAEYLRVPYADFNCLKLPGDAKEKEDDYVMLADIFPTGWHATQLACVQPGDSVVIYGSGPVGLMAAYSATLKSASKVMVVDRHPDRLKLAESIGAIPIDDSKGSPVEQVKAQTNGKGADRGCECVGYQAHDPQGTEHPNMTLNNLVQSVKFTGTIGVVGVYIPQDPNSPDNLYKQGDVVFDFGMFWFKGQTMGTGQCNVKAYNRQLCELIHIGKAKPSFIVSHRLPLNEAPEGYKHFDNRDPGWTKVLLKPGQQTASPT